MFVVSLANNNASNWAKRAYYVYAMLCVNIYAYAGGNKGSWTVFMSYTREARVAKRAGRRMGEKEGKQKKERTNLNCFRFTYFFSCFTLNCLLYLQLIFIFVESFPNLLAQQAATGNNKSPWQAVATLATCNLLKSVAQFALLPLLMPHMADLINYARGK